MIVRLTALRKTATVLRTDIKTAQSAYQWSNDFYKRATKLRRWSYGGYRYRFQVVNCSLKISTKIRLALLCKAASDSVNQPYNSQRFPLFYEAVTLHIYPHSCPPSHSHETNGSVLSSRKADLIKNRLNSWLNAGTAAVCWFVARATLVNKDILSENDAFNSRRINNEISVFATS